ncbi:MAG: SPOR domain-containing protein [Burkholderiales bacterium]
MRTLFLLLLLANLAFFAWARYLAQPDAGSDAQPLSRQIDPQKLPIVLPAPVRQAAAAARSAPVAAAADCVEWGSFTPTDLATAHKLLEPLALGARLSERQVEETANWWVYIPLQGDRQGALRKGDELKALGVDDFFVVQDEGSYQWSISLGVFRSEAAAQARLADLKAKGVRSAQVGARASQMQKVWLQVHDTDAALRARLGAVAQSIQGSELRDCK